MTLMSLGSSPPWKLPPNKPTLPSVCPTAVTGSNIHSVAQAEILGVVLDFPLSFTTHTRFISKYRPGVLKQLVSPCHPLRPTAWFGASSFRTSLT